LIIKGDTKILNLICNIKTKFVLHFMVNLVLVDKFIKVAGIVVFDCHLFPFYEELKYKA